MGDRGAGFIVWLCLLVIWQEVWHVLLCITIPCFRLGQKKWLPCWYVSFTPIVPALLSWAVRVHEVPNVRGSTICTVRLALNVSPWGDHILRNRASWMNWHCLTFSTWDVGKTSSYKCFRDWSALWCFTSSEGETEILAGSENANFFTSQGCSEHESSSAWPVGISRVTAQKIHLALNQWHPLVMGHQL